MSDNSVQGGKVSGAAPVSENSSSPPLLGEQTKSLEEKDANLESVNSAPQNALRLKVATLRGWTDVNPEQHLDWGGFREGKFGTRAEVPDYPRDLNAIHRAFLSLTATQKRDYSERLFRQYGTVGSINATAEQRCRAFAATMEGKSVQ